VRPRPPDRILIAFWGISASNAAQPRWAICRRNLPDWTGPLSWYVENFFFCITCCWTAAATSCLCVFFLPTYHARSLPIGHMPMNSWRKLCSTFGLPPTLMLPSSLFFLQQSRVLLIVFFVWRLLNSILYDSRRTVLSVTPSLVLRRLVSTRPTHLLYYIPLFCILSSSLCRWWTPSPRTAFPTAASAKGSTGVLRARSALSRTSWPPPMPNSCPCK